jgi:LysM repeat protein
MNTLMAKFNFLGSKALAALWDRRVLIGQWMPGVVAVALALTLASAATALAAGSERTADSLVMFSTLPTATPAPTAVPTATSVPASSSGFYYTVRPGDTLYRIAWRFGTTVAAIVQANGIVNPNQIFSGQVFWIPSASSGPTGSNVYVVRRGDTLYSIARRYGTTYQALAALNGLRYPYTIYVGQRLVVSGSGTTVPPSGRVHVVQPGDTLYSLALRYGTTPWAIAEANGLWNLNFIYVGQRLVIP